MTGHDKQLTARTIVLLLVLWGVLTSLQFFVLGKNSYCRVHDNADANLPMLVVSHEIDGPFNKAMLGGLEFRRELNANSFLFSTLPPWSAYALLMILQRILAAVLMFLMARHILGLTSSASLLAGLLYPFLVALMPLGIYHNFGEPGLPGFILLFWWLARVDSLWMRLIGGFLAGLLIAFATSVFLHQPFITLIIAYVVLFLDPKRFGRYIGIGIAAGVGVTVLELPTVLSTLSSIEGSQRILARSPETTQDMVNNARGEVFFLIFDRPVHLVAMAAGILFGSWRIRTFRVMLVGLIFCSLFGYVVSWMLAVVLHIDFFNSFQSDRFYHFRSFFLILTAVSTVHDLQARETSLGRLRAVVLMVLIAGSVLLQSYFAMRMLGQTSTFPDFGRIGAVILAVVTAYMLFALVFQRWWMGQHFIGRYPGRVLAGGLAVALVFIAFERGFRDFTSRQETFSNIFNRSAYQTLAERSPDSTPFRVATLFPTRYRHPAFVQLAGLETIDGYSSMYPYTFHLYWRQVIRGAMQHKPIKDYFEGWGQRVYLFGDGRYTPPTLIDSIGAYADLDLLSLANVRYLISTVPVDDPDLTLDAVDADPLDTLYTYRNAEALERAFVVNGVRRFDDKSALYEALGTTPIDSLREELYVLTSQFPAPMRVGEPYVASTATTDSVAFKVVQPARLRLGVTSSTDGYVVVSLNNRPGWQAEVNGRKTDVLFAYGTFLAVPVPAGKSQVNLMYQSR